MRVFFDTEFTGLHQHTTLISIGLIAEIGPAFYAECGDYDHLNVEPWVQENVIGNLRFHNLTVNGCSRLKTQKAGTHQSVTEVYGHREFVANCLKGWIADLDCPLVEMWGDCLSYDWVLFCQLWGHAFNLPESINYIPFDLATMFRLQGIDPDISREFYAGMVQGSKKHNALWDAEVIKACYDRLVREKDRTEPCSFFNNRRTCLGAGKHKGEIKAGPEPAGNAYQCGMPDDHGEL